MEKWEFEHRYARNSGCQSFAELSEWMLAMPCACGDETCDGWAMVSREQLAIDSHLDLYAPTDGWEARE